MLLAEFLERVSEECGAYGVLTSILGKDHPLVVNDAQGRQAMSQLTIAVADNQVDTAALARLGLSSDLLMAQIGLSTHIRCWYRKALEDFRARYPQRRSISRLRIAPIESM